MVPVDKEFSLLIVEDEDAARDLLESVVAMKYPKAVIHTATDGRIGLDRFRLHPYDIVVTDVNMPDMNGIQMAREIKALNPGTRIIVLTAFSFKTILEDSDQDGSLIQHYILKPVEYERLFDAIAQC